MNYRENSFCSGARSGCPIIGLPPSSSLYHIFLITVQWNAYVRAVLRARYFSKSVGEVSRKSLWFRGLKTFKIIKIWKPLLLFLKSNTSCIIYDIEAFWFEEENSGNTKKLNLLQKILDSSFLSVSSLIKLKSYKKNVFRPIVRN